MMLYSTSSNYANSTQITIGDEGARALAQNTSIIFLNLWGNNIGAEGAAALARNSTITNLNLRYNKIGDAGALALASNNTITNLNIAWNNIGDEGAKVVARNSTIITLDVSYNKIGDEGAEALARNSTIITLDVSYNNIGDAGAIALAKNRIFITLDLRNNKIGEAGARALASNNLNLWGNNIGKAGDAALAENTSITTLDVSYNKIGDAGVIALAGIINTGTIALSEDQLKIRNLIETNKERIINKNRMERVTNTILKMSGAEGFDCVDGEKSLLNDSEYFFLKEYTKAAVNYMIFKSSNNDKYRNKVYDRFRTLDRNEIFEQIGRDILHADGKFFIKTGISKMGLPIETRERNTWSIPSKGVSESTTYLPGDVAGNIAAFLRNLDVGRSPRPIIEDAPAATATPATANYPSKGG